MESVDTNLIVPIQAGQAAPGGPKDGSNGLLEAGTFEALLAEASLGEVSVESGGDGQPSFTPPDASEENGTSGLSFEALFSGELEDPNLVVMEPQPESGAEPATVPEIVDVQETALGLDVRSPIRTPANFAPADPGSPATGRTSLSEPAFNPPAPSEEVQGIQASLEESPSSEPVQPSQPAQPDQSDQSVDPVAPTPLPYTQEAGTSGVSQLNSGPPNPLAEAQSSPVARTPNSVPMDLDLKKLEVREIQIKTAPRTRNLPPPQLSAESELLGRVVTANLRSRPTTVGATSSESLSMPEDVVVSDLAAGNLPGVEDGSEAGTNPEGKPLWRLALELDREAGELDPSLPKKSVEARPKDESGTFGSGQRKGSDPGTGGHGTKGAPKEFSIQAPSEPARVGHEESYARSMRSVSRPQPVRPLLNPNFTAQPAHSVTMMVGEADSEVRVQIRATGDDLTLRFDAASGLRSGLEGSLGQLMDSLTREQVSVSDVAFSDSNAHADTDSRQSSGNQRQNPKGHGFHQGDLDDPSSSTPEFISQSSGTLVNTQA